MLASFVSKGYVCTAQQSVFSQYCNSVVFSEEFLILQSAWLHCVMLGTEKNFTKLVSQREHILYSLFSVRHFLRNMVWQTPGYFISFDILHDKEITANNREVFKNFLVQFIVYGSPACGHFIIAVFMLKYRSLIVSVLEQFSKPVVWPVYLPYDYYKTNIISLCILLYVNLKRSPSRCLSFSLEFFGNF